MLCCDSSAQVLLTCNTANTLLSPLEGVRSWLPTAQWQRAHALLSPHYCSTVIMSGPAQVPRTWVGLWVIVKKGHVTSIRQVYLPRALGGIAPK